MNAFDVDLHLMLMNAFVVDEAVDVDLHRGAFDVDLVRNVLFI